VTVFLLCCNIGDEENEIIVTFVTAKVRGRSVLTIGKKTSKSCTFVSLRKLEYLMRKKSRF